MTQRDDYTDTATGMKGYVLAHKQIREAVAVGLLGPLIFGVPGIPLPAARDQIEEEVGDYAYSS